MYDYGWRNYAPDIGRWITPDPLLQDLDFTFNPDDADEDDDDEMDEATTRTLGVGGGIFNPNNLNPYVYGYNDPVRFNDPDGKCPICILVLLAVTISEPFKNGTGNQQSDRQAFKQAESYRNNQIANVVTGGGGGSKTGASVIVNVAKKEVQKQVQKEVQKTFQTYTKTNPKNGEVYSGKTSGTKTPQKNVETRDGSHHMNKKGFGPAKLDKSSKNSDAIRGREQQLIKKNGGAKSQGGTSGNQRNSVSPNNPNAKKYEDAAKKLK